ncbi:hypothetical protein DFJ77DRAFT_251086 [Powellomyces hirtus]|nr:hypothetical protein DFJ77DRAFT_251086 [Powellomyces hirtus]
MSLDTLPDSPRAIIQLDIDYFYAQTEEVRDPALKDKPVAIQQKHIVVTSNYVARSFGVGKLELLTEAIKRCPNLVIIDGSDITRYRRASRLIFDLVRKVLNGGRGGIDDDMDSDKAGWTVPVEKLGMDELFIDCTELIRRHLATLSDNDDVNNNKIVVALGNGASFTYLRDQCAAGSHQIGSFDSETPSQQSKYLRISTHLASFLRSHICAALGYTTSAGIAHNKLFAKLAASVRKPNAQTLLIAGVDAAKFFDNAALRALPGVGSMVRKTLQAEVERVEREQREATEEEEIKRFGSLGGGVAVSADASDGPYKPSPLTVAHARTLIPLSRLTTLFPPKLGTHLSALLNGHDTSAVLASTAPQQISVEDSFPHCTSPTELAHRLHALATLFITRLQEEEHDLQTNTWRRHAKTVRLTTRLRQLNIPTRHVRAWMDDRETRSAPLPVDIWDASMDVDKRAKCLTETTLLPLFRKLVPVDEPFDCTLLNVAATGFVKGRVEKNIRAFFSENTSGDTAAGPNSPLIDHAEGHNGGEQAEMLDRTVLAQLPPDIREEVLRDYRDRAATRKRPPSSLSKLPSPPLPPPPAKKNKSTPPTEQQNPLLRLWGKNQQHQQQHQRMVQPSATQPIPALAVAKRESGAHGGGRGQGITAKDTADDDAFACPRCQAVLHVWTVEQHGC